MRRVLISLAHDATDFARTLAGQWDRFWFTPADPTLLGLLRILTGMMLFYTHAVWGLALDAFFGRWSWLDEGFVRALQGDEFAYSFWWWVPAGGTRLAYGVSMVILALFALGVWTRLTSILALIVAVSFVNRVPAALFGLDQINVMLTLYLALGPSGQALSIDRWLALRRQAGGLAPPSPSAGANLAQRLIQVHMCVIYFFAGISKLQGPAWWNGEAMWRAFANLEYQSADMTWMAWHPWLVNLITHASILWELSFCVLIWSRTWRPLVLTGAVVLHLGIGACLGMWTFGLIMLVGCTSFLPNEAVRQFVAARVPRWLVATPVAVQAGALSSPTTGRVGQPDASEGLLSTTPATSPD
jgi:hypothetical protein